MRKILVIALMGVCVLSAKAQFQEGKHYIQVSGTATEGPEIVEFFSLFCGHCNAFEKLIPEYKKSLPEGTKFEKSHVDYIPRNNPEVSTGMVKAFLTIQELEMDDKLIPAFFNRIHVERKPMMKESEIKDVFIENGVSESDFEKHYNGEKVARETKRMIGLWKERRVTTVPSLLINGKYLVAVSNVSSLEELNKLTDFLMKKK